MDREGSLAPGCGVEECRDSHGDCLKQYGDQILGHMLVEECNSRLV